MARPRSDPKQKAELVGFLDELYRLGGYETQAQWVREAGYYTPNLSNAMNRAKPDGVDGFSLVRLIRAVADRAQLSPAEAATRASAEAAAPASSQVGRRLESLAADVAEVARDTALILQTLGVQATGDELSEAPPSPTPAPAKRQRKSS